MVKKRGNEKKSHKSGFLRVHAFAHSLGILSLISIIFYAIFVWFAGFDGILFAGQFPISFNFNDWTFLYGVAQGYVLGYIAGWIFARIYNNTN